MKQLRNLVQKIRNWFRNQNLKHRQNIADHAFGWYDDKSKGKILVLCENLVIAVLDNSMPVEEVDRIVDEYRRQAKDFLDSDMYE